MFVFSVMVLWYGLSRFDVDQDENPTEASNLTRPSTTTVPPFELKLMAPCFRVWFHTKVASLSLSVLTGPRNTTSPLDKPEGEAVPTIFREPPSITTFDSNLLSCGPKKRVGVGLTKAQVASFPAVLPLPLLLKSVNSE